MHIYLYVLLVLPSPPPLPLSLLLHFGFCLMVYFSKLGWDNERFLMNNLWKLLKLDFFTGRCRQQCQRLEQCEFTKCTRI